MTLGDAGLNIFFHFLGSGGGINIKHLLSESNFDTGGPFIKARSLPMKWAKPLLRNSMENFSKPRS